AALALLFSALAVMIGVSASLWLTSSIHRPVKDLRAATVALSRGEFDRRIDVRRHDELGDLARAFNEMAARLQELDELKSGFVSMVSHDLKTPLTSMKEAVDLLAEGVGGELTDRQRRLLSITREGAERLGNYVQGILDLFRFEAGHVRLVKDPLSLAEVVQEQTRLLEVRSRIAGIEIHCETEADLPPVEADRFRIGQVVANLLDNAIKFTPRDGTITVKTGVEAWRDDLAVVLRVKDTGLGINQRDLKHVFDKFFQATVSRDRHVPGAGLGLAIVRSLVEAHGGEISVDSAVGQGSTFTVILPAASRLGADQQVLAG
ncbi:MAG: ATP-binding protein, partial [Acidobacteriota bacterium]